MKPFILESQYVGTLLYFHLLNISEKSIIDVGEHYIKSTFRNRLNIPGPNGIMLLTVPLKKGKNQRSKMKDIEISYDHLWQKIHWDSLCACYRRSPYFEFYEDELYEIFNKKFHYLVDINKAILTWSIRQLNLDVDLTYSNTFLKNNNLNYIDWRIKHKSMKLIKELDMEYTSPKYIQVFEEKIGFKENMSILDIIFNEGPNAGSFFSN